MLQEFIKFSWEHFNIIIYFISLIIAIRNYNKFFDTVLKYFPIIIAYTFFNELLGYFIKYSDQFAFFTEKAFVNDLIYNIYDLFYYGFYYWVYYKLIDSKFYKNSILILGGLVVLSYSLSAFIQNPLTIGLYYARAAASVVLVIFIVLYSFEKKLYHKIIDNKRNLMLWVTSGLLLFHSVFPYLFLTGYLKPEIWYEYNFQFILRLLIVVMYTFFCIGFIVSKRPAFR